MQNDPYQRFAARRARHQQQSARPLEASAVPLPAPATAPEPRVDVQAAIAVAVRKDRARIRSILEAPEAAGRARSAASLAFDTDDDVEKVRSMLARLRRDDEVDVDAAAQRIASFQRRPASSGGSNQDARLGSPTART